MAEGRPPAPALDLAIVGAGVAGCALAAALRRRGWRGSLQLLEIGRGPGGRAATRRSRHDPDLRLNHGAPLFNIASDPAPALLEPLLAGGWIEPWSGAIASLDGEGRIGPPLADGFSAGALYRGRGAMDHLARGLLALAEPAPLRTQTLVRQLEPLEGGGWRLVGASGEPLLDCHWLVLSGTLLAHPRSQTVFGWSAVPLQEAAAQRPDPALQRACAALAAGEALPSSNLLLQLPPEAAAAWLQQPWRLLQCSPEAQERWGLRRLSIQPQAQGRCAVVAESSAAFARGALGVYGSRSAAAQLLGAAPDPAAEQAVLDGLEQALQAALGLSTAGAERQLMRWGAALPLPPGLPAELRLCPQSRIGFCGDGVDGPGFGRIEGALRSAEALAAALEPQLLQ